MKNEDLMIIGLAAAAVYLILKQSGVIGAAKPAAKPPTVWYSDPRINGFF